MIAPAAAVLMMSVLLVGIGAGVAGATGPLTIHSVTPVRLLDTRSGNGAPAAKVGPGQTITLQITGRGGIPSSGVSAVSVNFTVTGPTAGTFVTAWPAGASRPNASTLNAAANQTIANSTIVQLSAQGRISIYNYSGSTHVIADVNGWLPTGSDFTGVTPVRLLDTRSGNGAPAVKVGPGQTITVQITGQGGVPSSGVSAVSVNFTVTAPTTTTFVTTWPAGEPQPNASTLNAAANQTVANSTIVKLSAGGAISIYNNSGSTHVIADVNGWFPTASFFVPVTPVRLLDTRSGSGAPAVKVAPGQTITVQITGRGGIPSSGVSAVSVNFTVTGPTASTFVTAWPAGATRPTASTLNAAAGQTIANSTIVKLSALGQISIYNNSGSAHVIADIGGWFPPQGIEQLDGNGGHGCAVMSDTSVKCWGFNITGQLGDPLVTANASLLPTTVYGLTGAIQVATGIVHSCALLSNGTVRCWGDNSEGQLGDGATGAESSTPVAVNGIANAVDIAAGEATTCAVISDGTVKCWGYNDSGQLGNGTLSTSATPVSVFQLSNAVSISAGARHMCAILATGQVRCWGENGASQLGDSTTVDRLTPVSPVTIAPGTRVVTDIAGGTNHTCAVTYDAAASPEFRILRKCWGDNDVGQYGNGLTARSTTPMVVADSFGSTAVSAGSDYTCWLRSTVSARCSGGNEFGQLGDGSGADQTTLVEVPGLTGIRQIDSASMGASTCAVLLDGTGRCWGNNTQGQLGDGTAINRLAPVVISGL